MIENLSISFRLSLKNLMIFVRILCTDQFLVRFRKNRMQKKKFKFQFYQKYRPPLGSAFKIVNDGFKFFTFEFTQRRFKFLFHFGFRFCLIHIPKAVFSPFSIMENIGNPVKIYNHQSNGSINRLKISTTTKKRNETKKFQQKSKSTSHLKSSTNKGNKSSSTSLSIRLSIPKPKPVEKSGRIVKPNLSGDNNREKKDGYNVHSKRSLLKDIKNTAINSLTQVRHGFNSISTMVRQFLFKFSSKSACKFLTFIFAVNDKIIIKIEW